MKFNFINKLLILYICTNLNIITLAENYLNLNDGYTFGDVYNQGEIKNRTNVNFQKDSTLERVERADGNYQWQKERFLSEESKIYKNHIKTILKNKLDYTDNNIAIKQKNNIFSNSKLENNYNNQYYKNISKSKEKEGQRVETSSQKRIIMILNSKNRKYTYQDSTFISVRDDQKIPSIFYDPNRISHIKIHTLNKRN